MPSTTTPLPSEEIAEQVAAIGVQAQTSTDVATLHMAVRALAGLAHEALEMLSHAELDVLARWNIPRDEGIDVAASIEATPHDLAWLQTAASTSYMETAQAIGAIGVRLGPQGSRILMRQLVYAGAATLLEIVDAEDGRDEDLDTRHRPAV